LSFSHLFCTFGGILSSIRCDSTGICDAAASAERFAALVSFQRYLPGFPPCKNVDSADRSRVPACHFGGNSAQSANPIMNCPTYF
jgi:hypothetical protein